MVPTLLEKNQIIYTSHYPVIEIFSSVQGEGIYAGQRHLFLRFDHCNIACTYCDELGKPSSDWTTDEISGKISELLNVHGAHQFLSFTGGEPLLYPEAIVSVCQKWQGQFGFYLETNGNLPEKLKKVISSVDVVAMDIKLKSVSNTENTFRENREFLKISLEAGKETFVKIVVRDEIDFSEFRDSLGVIHEMSSSIPLVLQPLSLSGKSISTSLLLDLQNLAMQHLKDVRIIPRLHEIFQIP